MASYPYSIEPAITLLLDMYSFLIKPIRDQDRQAGNGFLRRFLQGGQSVWQTTVEKIESIKDLWSVTECPDEFLQYLKRVVGWTPDLDGITNGLDATTLRRLIAVSVPMWKKRSTETSIVDAINLLTSRRSRVWNWFDFRWVTDETVLSEEHQGRDPWMVQFPGPPAGRELWSNVRLVDPGAANHQVVRDVLNLMRPCGERYLLTYLKFLDLFEIDGDAAQWDVLLGGQPTVETGILRLTDTTQVEGVVANTSGSADWSNHVVYGRFRGGPVFGLLFYCDLSVNAYSATLSVADNKLKLEKLTAGTPALIAEFDLDTIDYALRDDVWYGLRVQVTPEGATNRIKVYFNSMELIDTTDATWTKGTVAIYHGASSVVDCDEMEVMGLPVVTETVEINY